MNEDFAAGYELGYHSGHEVGYAAAEADMAEAWAAEVHRIRALAQPDDFMRRVAAAEQHGEAVERHHFALQHDAIDQEHRHRRAFANGGGKE